MIFCFSPCFKMIITKTLLTEILLEVTNEEILHVAQETHRKATRGLLLSFPVYASSILFTKTLFLTLKRNYYVYNNLFKLDSIMPCKPGWLSSKHGSMSKMHFQPFSANASEEREQSNVSHKHYLKTCSSWYWSSCWKTVWLNEVSALTLTSTHL